MDYTSELFTELGIKPLPKKPIELNFLLPNANAPNIIDKTKENLIDPLEFMSRIGNMGFINKTKDYGTEREKATLAPKSKIDIVEAEKIGITNIMKTGETLFILGKLHEKPPEQKDAKKTFADEEQQKDAKKTFADEEEQDAVKEQTIKKERTKKVTDSVLVDKAYVLDLDTNIKDVAIKDRLKNKLKYDKSLLIKASPYYLYNRETFITSINNYFDRYKDILNQEERDIQEGKITVSCDKTLNNDFSLLIHQKIVRDYLNVYSPYRGLLLFHGLGSGKTCSSIAITEGLKNDKQIIVMTPASLRANYIEELKKCGDYIYKKNQYWEFISTTLYPDYLKPLSSILKLSEEYIKTRGGAWLINNTKETNFESLNFTDQKTINEQITKMIDYKYKFISYNGLRNEHLLSLTNNNTINPFDNKVIIIDEAHNFISRIVNKIKNPNNLSMKLYNYLMDAENCKIILLTGTPIINYPNEIAVLFNILRGYIKTFNFKLNEKLKTYTEASIIELLKKNQISNTIDNITYNSKTKMLSITKNPFGFVNTDKKKIEHSKEHEISNTEFHSSIVEILKANNIAIDSNGSIENYKLLPDILEEFKSQFIDATNKIQNSTILTRRILGLSSYFRSAQEQLMPKYTDESFHEVYIEMSDYQLNIYEKARVQERNIEETSAEKRAQQTAKPGAKQDLYDDVASTYRIFSRQFCNFVFPESIKRPMPKQEDTIETALNNLDMAENKEEGINAEVLEDIFDNKNIKDKIKDEDNSIEEEDLPNIQENANKLTDEDYQSRILKALKFLESNSSEYLSENALQTYSPKYLSILKNMQNAEMSGIHLLYSQFKTMEGIGIFKLVLKANGFVEFKIKKNSKGQYELNVDKDQMGKPMFASYSGDESPEEREIIKNVLNSNWSVVPSNILTAIKTIAQNNYMGDVIKVLMITSSGAEGISLQNVRYVHIMESYWHPVRIEQVIGRARRICSHNNLPKELQTVEVYLYLMHLSKKQMEADLTIELRTKDKAKGDRNRVVTSDEYLYEVANLKKALTQEILNVVKQASIDCVVHSNSNAKENIRCYSIGNPNPNEFIYNPNIKEDKSDKDIALNVEKTVLNLVKLKMKINGKEHAYDKKTLQLFQIDPVTGERLLVGYIEQKADAPGKYKPIFM